MWMCRPTVRSSLSIQCSNSQYASRSSRSTQCSNSQYAGRRSHINSTKHTVPKIHRARVQQVLRAWVPPVRGCRQCVGAGCVSCAFRSAAGRHPTKTATPSPWQPHATHQATSYNTLRYITQHTKLHPQHNMQHTTLYQATQHATHHTTCHTTPPLRKTPRDTTQHNTHIPLNASRNITQHHAIQHATHFILIK